MRIMIFLLLMMSYLFSSEFYAKLEPYETYLIKSAVSGKIIYANDKMEGFKANNSTIIKIDSKLSVIDLEQSRNKLKYLNEMISIEKLNYNRLKKVSSKSQFEKDSQKLKIINLESSRADLLVKIETLKDDIFNKKLVEKSNYIYNIAVKKGDYVNPGTLLYEAKDLSKGKLEFFVPISDINTIKNKKIFLDGKESNVKINKIFEVADTSHISSYKVQLLLSKVNKFSRLIKIEFK